MKKLLAILVAGAFATSAFAVGGASAPAQMDMSKPTASSAKHHNKKHSKKHKKHASAAM